MIPFGYLCMKRYQHINFRALKTLRENSFNYQTKAPYTQGELAKRLGMSQKGYSRIETGNVISPKPEIIQGIAAAFSTTEADLLNSLPKRGDSSDERFRDALEKSPLGGMHNYFNAPRLIDLHKRSGDLKGLKYRDAVLFDEGSGDAVVPPPCLINSMRGYAIEVPTDDMEPRYRKGDTLFVDPDLSPYYGDDVVVKLSFKDRTVLLVRELVCIDSYYLNYKARELDDWEMKDGKMVNEPLPAYGVLTSHRIDRLKRYSDEDWEDPLVAQGQLRKFCEYFLPEGPIDEKDGFETISVDVIVACERKRNIREPFKLGSPDSWGKHVHPSVIDQPLPPEPPIPESERPTWNVKTEE